DIAQCVAPGRLRVAIREVRRMSLLLHKDRGQVLVVNREEKEASPRSYPLGDVGLSHVTGIPRKLSGPPCRAVFHRNVVAPVSDKCQALHRTRRPRSAEGFGNRLRSTSASSGKNESAVALGTWVARSCRHGRSPFALGRLGWRDRAGVARGVAAR